MTNLSLYLTYILGISVTTFTYYCYSIITVNQTFGTMMFPESNLTNIPSTTQEDSNLTDLSNMLLSEEEASIANSSSTLNNSQISFANNMQLTGTEQIQIETNFSSKPFGLSTDYKIDDKPVVIIDNQSLDFDYPIDNNDEVSVSDMLLSMRATIKVDNATTSNNDDIIQIIVSSYPENITESSNGSTSYVNSPNRLDYFEINGVGYPNIKAAAILDIANGNGTFRAETTQDSIAAITTITAN